MELLTDSARHLQGLGDRELQRVLALSRADYTPEAIAIAETELKRRSLAALTAEEYWQRFPEERITSTAHVTTPLDFPWGKLIFGAVLVWVAYHLHCVFTELETGARVSARVHGSSRSYTGILGTGSRLASSPSVVVFLSWWACVSW